MKWIEKIIEVNNYNVICLWNDDIIRNINLENFIFSKSDNSSFSPLKSNENFQKVKCDGTTLFWENMIYYTDLDGIKQIGNLDISPELLFEMSEIYMKKVM